ncbi:hypothetical protein JYU34_007161 [Plutella xylostella]|uniref:Uncharacterized protein n=1 Tax=Plutella xylostella TaxID=51655 RepID=A0ABQ7QPS1_PLUXY|nr:hypothetical protein JYU34_007161 [Plutella xylostella]
MERKPSARNCQCSSSSWTKRRSLEASTRCGSAWCCWWGRWPDIWSRETPGSGL